MDGNAIIARRALRILCFLFLLASCGCRSLAPKQPEFCHLPPVNAPNGLAKVVLPDYIIEPPDILAIEVLQQRPPARS